ncbi:MAG TPA: cobaltochelatase subunit CobN [Blastocatellia bacterium]|nr:cobaltochelatase subunit CobN [Blastocatellia bacterium]
MTNEERDKAVLGLYERVLEIEQRLIPTGMHVFGQAPELNQLASLLQVVASFDRYDPDIHAQLDGSAHRARALTDLVAAGLGFLPYSDLIKESVEGERFAGERERVESIVRRSVDLFLSDSGGGGAELAVSFLEREAAVAPEESCGVFQVLQRVLTNLCAGDELDALSRALRGEYIEPGPGADIIQNPEALPSGRNTHAINPYVIPSPVAVERARPVVGALLERHLRESGRYPQTIAMVLWGIDNIKTQGEAVAQALWLLGVTPLRDSLNRATDVHVVPLATLGRPRIDVVMTVSGIFRDLFGSTMALLDRAVRTVAALDEPDNMNYVRRNVNRAVSDEGVSNADAASRVFSNAAGNYGTNVNFMVLDSKWESANELGDLFVKRKCFAYGRGQDGREARQLMESMLARVELTYQNIDSVEVGIIDVDHYFEYLGGVSKAVEQRSGARPSVYVADSTSPAAKVRTLEETVRLETRTKTLNPKWYEGMLSHGFSGVAEIEHHVTNTFGWSATVDAVDSWIYNEVAATFVLDKAMLDRLKSLNPHSARSLVGRLLEAEGRGLWKVDEPTLDRLREAFEGIEDEIEGVVA